MTKSRLEAFSDGVIAILITIMVLELKVPHGTEWSSLRPLIPIALSYVLSFVYLGIYWNNHHHLLQATQKVGGGVLWANLHLLFWLSLVPFGTSWMGESGSKPVPVALYGIMLFGAGFAYAILERALLRHHDKDSVLARAIGQDLKGNASIAIYLTAIVASFWIPLFSQALYVVVAIMWLVPDRRIERVMANHRHE
jgi:uncharacterized membrane protein